MINETLATKVTDSCDVLVRGGFAGDSATLPLQKVLTKNGVALREKDCV